MEQEILDAMRKERKDMETIANRDFSELEELKKDPKVQRYISLKELIDSNSVTVYGTRFIVNDLMEKYGSGKIQYTNNIWCYFFEDVFKKVKYYNFSINDEFKDDDIVVLYIDIENDNRMIAIKKEKQEEFEKNNIVVYGKMSILDPNDRYYNTRIQFFRECLENGNEAGLAKMLTMRKQ